ncbi:MAG: ABC transporter permease subunit [Armatimonadota bacterium]|nr:ABC transporter permease subunit [Armatimonadota bacterium]
MSFIELVSWSVWDLMRTRKIATMVICGLMGPLFGALAKYASGSSATSYGLAMPMAVYSFTLIILSVVFAAGIVSSEMVGKTISYLLTRPIPRYKILLAKWSGATLVVALATTISAVLTALATYGADIGRSPILSELWLVPVGALAYCSIFTLMSVLSTKPWLFAVAFGFLWEAFVPFLPGDLKMLSIMAQLRALGSDASFASVPSGMAEALSMLNQNEIPAATAWNTLAILIVFSVIAACVIFTIGEFVPKDETG